MTEAEVRAALSGVQHRTYASDLREVESRATPRTLAERLAEKRRRERNRLVQHLRSLSH